MAEYVRFEVYLPVHYRIQETDPQTGKTRSVERALDTRKIATFIRACSRKFGGVTRANPQGPAPFKGWWIDDQDEDSIKHKRVIIVDHITNIIVLVKLSAEDDAMRFFERWKKLLAASLNQKVILITHHSVHAIGDY